MKKKSVEELKAIAKDLRKKVVTMIYEAQSGHPDGSLSAADFVTACYFSEMNVDPKNPKWEDRDRFVLSKGHVCPIQYAALGTLGFFPEEVLHTLRKEGSPLQGHPNMHCPGIDIPTGSLGQGFACAVGMAIALKLDKKSARVFSVLGDGECQEGEIWEAAQTANKYQLDNLVVFAIRMHRHNHKPKCIFGHTTKGKGVSYMENIATWHGVAPNKEEYEQAIKEIDADYSFK